MRLGIDFGTTRIVVAKERNGRHPLADFKCDSGVTLAYIPSLIAVRGDERFYGLDAYVMAGEEDVTLVRSIKSVLARCGPDTLVRLAHQEVAVETVLAEMLGAVRRQILENSTFRPHGEEPLDVVIGVPANANTNQRFLTMKGFQDAGFHVLGMLNEPTAACLEYLSLYPPSSRAPACDYIVVYDLGGGTFDTSLVKREAGKYEVVASEGIPALGGDTFDSILGDLALEKAGLQGVRGLLTAAERYSLEMECMDRKEAIRSGRRIPVVLSNVRAAWPEVAVEVQVFYDLCRSRIEETLQATTALLDRVPDNAPVSFYVTGGASRLPLVTRMLRDRFGQRVRHSAEAREATAVGLAIRAAGKRDFLIEEKLTRHFGLWREAESGKRATFDVLFGADTPVPPEQEKRAKIATYTPQHNIGHFRYSECSHLGPGSEPTGDIVHWEDIWFPYVPSLKDAPDLDRHPLSRSEEAKSQLIEERYELTADGRVLVKISNLTSGYTRSYIFGRPADAADAAEAPPGGTEESAELA